MRDASEDRLMRDLEEKFTSGRSKSRELSIKARNLTPSDVSANIRYHNPVHRLRMRPTIRDVDGNMYMDFDMRHGSVILGYGDEELAEALSRDVKGEPVRGRI